MARFHFACPMRWSDMDAFGHVNNVQFLTYLEEARVEMFNELVVDRVATEGLLARGIVVARTEIDYKRPLVHRTTPVPIDVWVGKVGGASFHLHYEVHDDDGRTVYARASSVMVPYDVKAERARRLEPHEREFLERYRDDPAE